LFLPKLLLAHSLVRLCFADYRTITTLIIVRLAGKVKLKLALFVRFVPSYPPVTKKRGNALFSKNPHSLKSR